ncbi:MAG: hypothetical protein U0230_26880 [Polyangiales bacterium]
MANDNQRLIEAIAPYLPGGQVQHDSRGTWEWRGLAYDLRTRVQAEGHLCRVTVEAPNPFGTFQLQWSPKHVPDPTAVDDDAFDVTDEVRVWVGHCVVIQCFGLELEQQLAGFRSFPSQGTAHLIEGMQRDHVSVLGVEPDHLVAYLARDNPDVVAATVRFTQLLAWTGSQMRTSGPSTPQAASTGGRLRCAYCRALYLLTPAGRCPHCGAFAS